jgi:hypothetical protein
VSCGRHARQDHGGVVARHGEAGERLGLTSGAMRLGMARPHAVWLCHAWGTGISGTRHDAAAEGATAAVGLTSGTTAPAQKVARVPDGRGGPRAGYRGFIGGPWLTPAARDRERRDTVAALTGGLLAEDLTRWRAGAGGSGPCRARGLIVVIVRALVW